MSDLLDTHLATVPRNLSAKQWRHWRGTNPRPYLLNRNRRGNQCGVCGSALTVLLRICPACHRREMDPARRDGRHALPLRDAA